MAAIIVRTNDFRLAFKLIKELRKRNTNFRLIDFDDDLPRGDLVWLGTEQEVEKNSKNPGTPVALPAQSMIYQSQSILLFTNQRE